MRAGDKPFFYPKSERIYKDTFGFWVKLREGLIGPFVTIGIAQTNLKSFLEHVSDDSPAPQLSGVAA